MRLYDFTLKNYSRKWLWDVLCFNCHDYSLPCHGPTEIAKNFMWTEWNLGRQRQDYSKVSWLKKKASHKLSWTKSRSNKLIFCTFPQLWYRMENSGQEKEGSENQEKREKSRRAAWLCRGRACQNCSSIQRWQHSLSLQALSKSTGGQWAQGTGRDSQV